MGRKSALGKMVAESMAPQLQQMAQMQQQATQAILGAIQSIPPAPGMDPQIMQTIHSAIQSIQQIDLMPFVQTMENMSMQIDMLAAAELRPTEWEFEIERDPQTFFITNVQVRPIEESVVMIEAVS